MSPERWTLLLMKGRDAPVRQFSLSTRALHFAAGGLVAFLTGASGFGVAVGFGGAARAEADRLQVENALLATTLEHLQGRVQGMEGTIEELAERDAQLRLVAGLEPIGDDVLEAGVGGPGSSRPDANPLFDLGGEVGESAFTVTYDLSALERRVRLLSESMEEADRSLASEHERLAATPSILPTPGGLLSSGFSQSRYHPIHNQALPHEGIDISAPQGTAILAAANGRVLEAGEFAGYGRMVEIDHGFGFTTRYGHASQLLVRSGQEVRRGDVIARVGSTGIATGPHLHYEVRVNGAPRNPLNYVLPGVVP